jgi:hypothetical protein
MPSFIRKKLFIKSKLNIKTFGFGYLKNHKINKIKV